MKSPLNYLLAARRCEIGELQRLADTSELVSLVGRCTHALQRERGITNIFLATHGQQFAAERSLQIAQSDAGALAMHDAFDALSNAGTAVPNGARLFHRIAVALHGLEGLAHLRAEVSALSTTPAAATTAYAGLIAGLLAVVFEAADSAGDPAISRVLGSLFNFMQGKEFAGQERALGAAVFASGHIGETERQLWRDLMHRQQHCLDLFAEFADPQVLAFESDGRDLQVFSRIEKLRILGQAPEVHGLPDAMCEWYDCCTARIDAMREVEDLLAARLRRLCERNIVQAQAALRDQQACLTSLQQDTGPGHRIAPERYGPALEQSVWDMLHEQSQRLQAMTDELEAVRSALNERKVVDRAKGVLMTHRQLSEDEAYKALRQMAMNQKRRMGDVAQGVLATAGVFTSPK